MRKTALVLCLVLVCAVVSFAPAATFSDSANANVLREWNPADETIAVPWTVDTTGDGASMWRHAANDGSMWNDEGNVPEGTTLTKTFELRGPRLVGSYSISFNAAPTIFVLEGYDSNLMEWVELARKENFDRAASFNETFTPTTVTSIRYVLTGPSTDGQIVRIPELQVFLDAGQTVYMTDGFNYLHDQVTDTYTATTDGPWQAPNGGNAGALVDDNIGSGVKCQQEPYGSARCFVAYALAAPVQMNMGALGFHSGQNFGEGYEIYTANGSSIPELQNLAGNDTATLEAAGWTYQCEVTDSNLADEFLFGAPGNYQYVAIVWDSAWGQANNFELFGGQNPIKFLNFEVADQNTGSTERTTTPIVDVTAFDVLPSYGSEIVSYIIDEDEAVPDVNDTRWQTTAPDTYMITDVQGPITLYAWAMDSDMQIAGATATILYELDFGEGFFSSASNVNVLRHWDVNTDTIIIPSTSEATGNANVTRVAANDGGGYNDEGKLPAGSSVTRTYDLGQSVTVGGYSIYAEAAPSSFELEGYTSDEVWIGLAYAPTLEAETDYSFTFEPTTVSKIRYTVDGPTTRGDDVYGINELRVFMAAGQAISLIDGYNIIGDQQPTCYTSEGGGVWQDLPDYWSAENLIDGNFGTYVRSWNEDSSDPTSRSFLAYEFPQPVRMNLGTLGFRKDNGWLLGYEVYTANGTAMPELQNLSANDQATIEAAGWTLQYITDAADRNVDRFDLRQPGEWQYLAIVWRSQWGSASNLEIFAGDPPAQIAAFEVADQATGDTTRTSDATVDINAFEGVPSYGASITGYMINEYDFPPFAQQTGWLTEKPTTYTITSPPGNVTLYAWVKDSDGQIAGATQTILYDSPILQQMFTDSADANVLRQFDADAADGGTLMAVPSEFSSTGEGTSAWRNATNDGSTWNDEGKLLDGGTITHTFTLRSEALVGSYYAQFENNSWPAQLDIQASMDGETWTELASFAPTGTKESGTFAPQSANYIRYIAYGPSADANNYLRFTEFQVFAASAQQVMLTEGYNYVTDKELTATAAQQAGVWVDRNGGDANVLINGDYWSIIKCQDNDDGTYGAYRTFVTYSFDYAYPMYAASLGFYKGQRWDNGWEVYTSDADVMPELQNLAANDPQTIQDAGWTLQHEGVSAQTDEFEFLQPGDYKHVAIVWNSAHGGAVEFELYGSEASSTWPIEGDANMDCKVNIIDLIFVRNRLNQDVASDDNWQADVNGDGKINIIDLIYVRNRLNSKCE